MPSPDFIHQSFKREAVRRVFWLIHLLDVMASIYFKKPSTFTSSELRLRLPVDETSFELGVHSTLPGEYTSLPFDIPLACLPFLILHKFRRALWGLILPPAGSIRSFFSLIDCYMEPRSTRGVNVLRMFSRQVFLNNFLFSFRRIFFSLLGSISEKLTSYCFLKNTSIWVPYEHITHLS
jgi:hypothetical protein